MREDVDGLADAERSLLKAEEYAHANLIVFFCCGEKGKKVKKSTRRGKA
jgi:hypothetical protein